MFELLPESEIEALLLEQIADVKRRHPAWQDPHALCEALGLRLGFGRLGPGREGAALANEIVLDSGIELAARRHFTLYHEIVHCLIRHNDRLYSTLHDQYRSDEDFQRITERLCDIGAAEFLLPRATVLTAVATQGFSVALVEALSGPEGPSRTAVCAQLAACAKHRCIAVVCRRLPPVGEGQVPMPGSSAPGPAALTVALAINSASMRYRVAQGTRIPTGHLLHEAYQSDHGDWVRGQAPIPFRNNSSWRVDCEAMRLGGQVFALFHADRPPTATTGQMRLPL